MKTLRTVALADLGLSLGPGRFARSRVTVGTLGRVDFIQSLGPREALRNAQYALTGNDVCESGRPFGSAMVRA